MTPTPAETTLWRALNPDRTEDRARMWATYTHPADRLAYFEGLVRERGGVTLALRATSQGSWAEWHIPAVGVIECNSDYSTPELTARFHAAARALHALGVVDDEQMKEVEDENA